MESRVAVTNSPETKSQVLLDVQNLTTTIHLRRGSLRPVENVSFHVNPGEILGVVGESGCGKSTAMLSIMRLVPPGTSITGQVLLEGKDLLKQSSAQIRMMRGKDVSMVFQEPMTALDPAFTIGYQLSETIRAHVNVDQREAERQAIEILGHVGIANASRRMRDYPHQFSGGMRQRVMIAMALLLKPRLLIVDEPTSALDVTIQAQMLDLLRQLKDEFNMSVIIITHDLGVVYEIADRVAVMYLGQVVEIAPTEELFENPLHPYTQALLSSIPSLRRQRNLSNRIHLEGEIPTAINPPRACRFAGRCFRSIDLCRQEEPPLEAVGKAHWVACFNYEAISLEEA